MLFTALSPENSSTISGFIAGAISGIVGVILPFPLESYRLRSLLHNNVESQNFDNKLMFKGLSAALVQGVLLRGVSFGTYDYTINKLSLEGDFIRDPLWHYACAGAVSSLSLSWIREPFGVFRSRVQGGTTAESSFINFMRTNALKSNGLRYLYSGYFSSSVTSMVSRASYFMTYELVKRQLFQNYVYFDNIPGMKVDSDLLSVKLQSSKQLPVGMRILAATVAGPVSWIIIYPFDVIRSRMRALDPNILPVKYTSFTDCFMKTAKEGHLFRGLGLTLMRSAPMASITLPLYESVYIRLTEIL